MTLLFESSDKIENAFSTFHYFRKHNLMHKAPSIARFWWLDVHYLSLASEKVVSTVWTHDLRLQLKNLAVHQDSLSLSPILSEK